MSHITTRDTISDYGTVSAFVFDELFDDGESILPVYDWSKSIKWRGGVPHKYVDGEWIVAPWLGAFIVPLWDEHQRGSEEPSK